MLILKLTRWIAAPVLAEIDLESPVLLLASYALYRLDSIRNIRKIHKRTTLLPQSINKLHLPKLLKISPQPLFRPSLIQIPNITIPTSTSRHRQRNTWWQSTAVFAPSDFKATVVDHETLQVGEGVKGCCAGGVDEGDEADVFVRDVADVV